MKDSALRLQDKTIFLTGPFNGVTQACIRALTEFGCDVAYVSQDNPNAGRYTEGINEAREVHPEYGRAGFFHMPLNKDTEVQEALGRVTGSLGRIDALVDASPLAWNEKTDPESAIAFSSMLAKECAPYLLAKSRGRVVYIFEDSSLEAIVPHTNAAGLRDMLLKLIVEMAREHAGKNVTVNGVSIGVTDDFLLKNFPKGPTIKKSLEELQQTHSGARLVEFHDIALGVAYFASALSGSVTGQTLRLTQSFHL